MIIIYGGSFNPPTIGHFEIAKYVLLKFPNSILTFMPTNDFYHKEDLINIKYRLEMLGLLQEKLGERVSVSNYEETRNEYCGTYYSLKKYINPYFLLGSDNLVNIDKWLKYPEVVIENKFIVIPRPNYNTLEIIRNNDVLNKYKDNFIVLNDFKKSNVSSSLYRKTKDSKYLLEEVEKYIKLKGLYR